MAPGPDIGAFTSAGNRYGSLNQDYVEVWRPEAAGAAAPGGGAAAPLLIGAVLDGHGILGESAARTGGAAVVRELRRLVGLCGGGGGKGAGGKWEGANGAADAVGGGAHAGAAGGDGGAGRETGSSGAATAGPRSSGGGDSPAGGAAAPRPPLVGLPESELAALVDAAFRAAHASALALYDDPPRTCSYPDARTGAAAVYCLKPEAQGGLHVYTAPAGARTAAGFRPLECGATCTVALLQGRRLVVGNVGDSSAVLGSLDDEGGVTARLLTRQHCGLHPEEAARIEAGYAGRVRILPNDGYMSVSAPSLWAGYELGVTRALGHKHMESFGVLHSPSVAVVDLRPEDCCVVLASDGVWDVMEPREVVNRVMDSLSDGKGPAAAARQLVEDAIALAQGAPGGDADNTSAVVIALPLGG
ncbi:phosphatase 2C-like [Raphidocelis subcapitata]|uniref:Phosphatase 2C-like n=1 Tax=Raphidocelis subcapitata TaxID=307507 RepID=A0A2V0PJ50_9CHLO|nr:phosphatase 2C-like [Raphidocelis subcapitata]|eukprot:GBF97075.1 phosphatase 2C-like [Raphidocelis subcapitata]